MIEVTSNILDQPSDGLPEVCMHEYKSISKCELCAIHLFVGRGSHCWQ